MFELLANIILLAFLVFTNFTHVLEANIPKNYAANTNNLMPDAWPRGIIILLVICIVLNIIKIIKKNKASEDKDAMSVSGLVESCKSFIKSKTFIGIVILVVAALILETVGFVVTAFLVLAAYGYLLGEKKVVRLLILSVLIALILHILFSGLLDVTLPRGTIGVLRNFALWMENLI